MPRSDPPRPARPSASSSSGSRRRPHRANAVIGRTPGSRRRRPYDERDARRDDGARHERNAGRARALAHDPRCRPGRRGLEVAGVARVHRRRHGERGAPTARAARGRAARVPPEPGRAVVVGGAPRHRRDPRLEPAQPVVRRDRRGGEGASGRGGPAHHDSERAGRRRGGRRGAGSRQHRRAARSAPVGAHRGRHDSGVRGAG